MCVLVFLSNYEWIPEDITTHVHNAARRAIAVFSSTIDSEVLFLILQHHLNGLPNLALCGTYQTMLKFVLIENFN